MTRKYLIVALPMLAVALMVPVAYAEDSEVVVENTTSVEVNSTSNSGKTDVRVRSNSDVETDFKEKRNLLEEQRMMIRKEAEERIKAAKIKGDATTTVRSQLKLKLEERWADHDEKRETLRMEFEAKRASSTERRVEWQQDVAERKVEHTTRVMLATIERLEQIIARIEARIAKVKAAGGATSESEAHIVEAKASLVEAEVQVNAFAQIDLSSETAQENFERIRTAAANAREKIREAHNHLTLAVRSLAAVSADINFSGNTSATTTAQ